MAGPSVGPPAGPEPRAPAPGRYRLSAPVGIGSLLVGLSSAGLRGGVVGGSAMLDRGAVCAWFAWALDFPDWFGGNWDALVDSLADLSWLGDRSVGGPWRGFPPRAGCARARFSRWVGRDWGRSRRFAG